MHSKLSFVLIGALSLSALAAPASAALITLTQGAYSFGVGGEFNATHSGLPGTPVTINGGSGYFETFCLEHSENFSPGGTYQVDISTAAVGGGGGAVLGQDPLDERTAWLYAAFITGTLPGYDTTNVLGQRQVDAGALQNAIWFLEQEVATLDTPLAVLYFNLSAAGIGQGIGNVRVANLYTIDGNGIRRENQSQLVMFTPAPGAAGAMGLFGLLATRRRR